MTSNIVRIVLSCAAILSLIAVLELFALGLRRRRVKRLTALRYERAVAWLAAIIVVTSGVLLVSFCLGLIH